MMPGGGPGPAGGNGAVPDGMASRLSAPWPGAVPGAAHGPPAYQQHQPPIRRPLPQRSPPQQPPPPPEQAEPTGTGGLAASVQVLLIALTAVTTSLAYLRYYSGTSFLVATGAAAGLAALTAAVAAARRWGALATTGLSLLGFLLVAVFVVLRSTLRHGVPSLDTITGLGTGLASGWSRMLSVTVPADPTGELVITPALVTWVATAVAVTLAIRTRAALAPVLPLLLAYGIGVTIAASRPVPGLVLVGVVLGELALLALVRASAADPRTPKIIARSAVSRLLFGLPIVVIATAAGIAGMHYVPVATGTDRFDPRTLVPVQLDISDNISPLATLKSQLREPDQELFTVRLPGDPTAIDRIRTSALDTYDGAIWSSSDRFLLAGSTLPADESLVGPRQITATVEVSNLAGPYLPSFGAPVRVTAPRFGFNAQSGVVVTDAPSLAGLRYDVVADLGPTAGLDSAVPVTRDVKDTALPPGLPIEMQLKGTQLAGAVNTPYAKLLAIQDHLRTLPYNLDTRPGHSYDALRRLFGANQADQVGYAEQFAAAFAVLARSQGFPTRVAVGYRLLPEHLDGDTYQVTAGDAHAWPEVLLAGHGWVAFEPTDPERKPGVVQERPKTDTAPEQDVPDEELTASTPTEDPNLPRLGVDEPGILDWALWVLIGLGVLLLSVVIGVRVAKFLRSRRRRTGSKAARVLGAWHDIVDRLVESGLAVSAAWTAAEVADEARSRLGEGAESLALLAPLATAAAFDPREPEESTVQQAWSLNSRIRRELKGTRGTAQRVVAWFDPRPLYSARLDDRRRRRSLDKLTKG